MKIIKKGTPYKERWKALQLCKGWNDTGCYAEVELEYGDVYKVGTHGSIRWMCIECGTENTLNLKQDLMPKLALPSKQDWEKRQGVSEDQSIIVQEPQGDCEICGETADRFLIMEDENGEHIDSLILCGVHRSKLKAAL